MDFPVSLVSKEHTCHVGDEGLILGHEDPMLQEMITHSSTLPWEIPWTEEPGGLQSMGLQELDITL